MPYEPLTPDALPDWTLGLVPGRLARLAGADDAGEQHYADYKTSSAAPSSGNATAGHITPPSA